MIEKKAIFTRATNFTKWCKHTQKRCSRKRVVSKRISLLFCHL